MGKVTPCMGVWIETIYPGEPPADRKSHPVWVCGLKLEYLHIHIILLMSHPVWVCGLKLRVTMKDHTINNVTPCMGVWIETPSMCVRFRLIMSHPVWVCGLKHEGSAIDGERLLSYPVWVCGLKHPR